MLKIKKYINSGTYILSSLLISLGVNAQETGTKSDEEDTHKVVITTNVGQSLVGSLFKLVNTTLNNSGYSTNVSQIPALQLSADYYATSVISIGAAASYQQFNIGYSNWAWIDPNNNLQLSNFNTTVTRTQIGARVLFHFYNKKRLDMFSGIRLGPTIWGVSTNSPDPAYDTNGLIKGGSFAFQVVYFGLRGYITDNIGLNFELAVGSPYYVSGGLNFRFLK